MLIDDITSTIRAGKGGDGKASFRRNAQTARGGPDGGNGGKGGDVYLVGINDITALSSFAYKKEVKAEDGVAGGKNNLFGRKGKDIIIKVPLGTLITDVSTDEQLEILTEGQNVLFAKGGVGGRGNNEFKTAIHQAPKEFEKGLLGEVKKVRLQLRIIADIGLIGQPNAGKSSLLKALTNAHPKIGDYPFTTLEPNLGVMQGIFLSDIPGLIEGAAHGKGLGVQFLKHVEKTALLVHCIDGAEDDIKKKYKTVRTELQNYNTDLLNKPEIILLTKVDLLDSKNLATKLQLVKKMNKNAYPVSIFDEEKLKKIAELFLQHVKK